MSTGKVFDGQEHQKCCNLYESRMYNQGPNCKEPTSGRRQLLLALYFPEEIEFVKDHTLLFMMRRVIRYYKYIFLN